MIFILEGFRRQDHYIVLLEDKIAPGNKNPLVPLHYGNNDSFRQVKLGDALIDPGIPGCKVDFDKMHVFFPPVFGHPLDAGVLIHKSRGYNTGRDRHHAHSQKCDKNTEQFSKSGYGIDIPVSDGKQSGRRPPDAGKCVGKYFRLRFVFQAVHAQAGRNHENQYGKYRGEELLPFAVQYFCNQPEGIIVGIDPEQPEYPHDSQHPESHRTGREEDRQIIGEKGKHVHDSGKGQDIFADSLQAAGFRMSIFCRPYPEQVVQAEHGYGNIFQNKKQTAVPHPVFFHMYKEH